MGYKIKTTEAPAKIHMPQNLRCIESASLAPVAAVQKHPVRGMLMKIHQIRCTSDRLAAKGQKTVLAVTLCCAPLAA
jgi:hypothetical protein